LAILWRGAGVGEGSLTFTQAKDLVWGEIFKGSTVAAVVSQAVLVRSNCEVVLA